MWCSPTPKTSEACLVCVRAVVDGVADALARRHRRRSRFRNPAYLHGGSHVVGSPRTALSLTAGLVVRTGIPGISLDYRLAPEHPFPADVDDVVAAYKDLLDQGHAPESIAFAGDSAGGGLTITGALAARDAGLPMPAAIVAFSPGLDATRTGQSMTTEAAAGPLLDRAALDRMSSLYVVDQDRRNPCSARQ